MLKKIIILTLMASSFIGCEQPCNKDGVLVSGLCIKNNGLEVNLDEIVLTVKTLEEQIQIRYPEVINLVKTFEDNNVTVTFSDKALARECKKVQGNMYQCKDILGGWNSGGNDIYVWWADCLAWTSLGHELLHSIEKYYLDRWESANDHLTPWLFVESEKYNIDDIYFGFSIERTLRENLVCNLESCSDHSHYMCGEFEWNQLLER